MPKKNEKTSQYVEATKKFTIELIKEAIQVGAMCDKFLDFLGEGENRMLITIWLMILFILSANNIAVPLIVWIPSWIILILWVALQLLLIYVDIDNYFY